MVAGAPVGEGMAGSTTPVSRPSEGYGASGSARSADTTNRITKTA